MASILPLPMNTNNTTNANINNLTTATIDVGRPGQQLLPGKALIIFISSKDLIIIFNIGYVVKLLKTLKIPFGTDRTLNGVDVDPSIALVGHIIDCLGIYNKM